MDVRRITERVDSSTGTWGPTTVRYLAALLWLTNASWKVPPSFGDTGDACRGLCRYVQYGIDYPVFPGSAWFFETVVQPNLTLFGWATLFAEAGLAILLLSGRWLRVSGVLGIAMSISIMASVANAPDEWYWSYVLMAGLSLAVLILAPAMSSTRPRVMAAIAGVYGVMVAWAHAGAGFTGDRNRSWTLFGGSTDIPDELGRNLFYGSIALGALVVAVAVMVWFLAGAGQGLQRSAGIGLAAVSFALLATYGPDGLLLRLGSRASTACVLTALGLSLVPRRQT